MKPFLHRFIFIITLFIHGLNGNAQPWPKIINLTPGTRGNDLDELYDHSFLLTGNITSGMYNKMGLLCKIDVNGNIIWWRKIDNNNYYSGLSNSCVLIDKGIVSTGFTFKYDLVFGDMFIIKMDVCGQKEWCKIYNYPGKPGGGIDVKQLPNENILVLGYESGVQAFQEHVWLYCLSPAGQLLWQKVYCQNDPKMRNGIPNCLLIENNNSFLITGSIDYEDTLISNLWWVEPLMVKADSNGNEIWARPWTSNTNEFVGWANRTILDPQGNIYSVGPRFQIPPNNTIGPSLFKSDASGNPISHTEFMNHPTIDGVASTINQISPNELIISYRYTDPGWIDHVMVTKTDTLGNVLLEKELNTGGEAMSAGIITQNQKILLTGSKVFNSQWNAMLYKLTPELENDTLDTTPYNYDSLCPNVVFADTIDLDCDVIVNVQEPMQKPEAGRLKIAPNPARHYITINLPEFYSSTTQHGSLSIQTTWYIYPASMSLEFFDLLGRPLLTQNIETGQKELTIDISGFPSGMCFVRLIGNGKMLTSGKFIVE